jgi:transposase InsO family protein
MTAMEGVSPISTALQIMIKPTELEWIIDSGATHHMTPLRQALTNISSLNKAIAFSTASKTSMIAKEKGEMKVKMASGRILTITDVHYVPELRVNLLSPSRMMRHGWKVNITDTGGSLSRNKERVSIRRRGDLWTIRLGKNQATAMLTGPLVKSRTPLEAEHQRLGHIGRSKLLDLAREGKLSISSKTAESDRFRITDCDVCQQQKMPRYPKSGNSPRAKRNGELIHADIAGPFTPSLNGYNHFLAMIDDFSNVCGIVPMVGRKPALEALKDFVVKVERQLGEKVRFIRTDNGTEFVKAEAEQWYRKKGIIHQLTTPYTPELNGTIERFMRTAKEMISAIIMDAGLGHGYWDYAAKYAAVIIMKI